MAGEQATITGEIAAFIVGTRYRDLSPTVTNLSRRAVLDGLAVIMAGSKAPCSQVIQRYVKQLDNSGRSSILGTSFKAQEHLAALANGTSGHALDYDDTQLPSTPDRIYGLLTHPTIPILASAFAVGEAVNASGASVLAAFTTGVEISTKLAEAINPHHYKTGFHSTGTLGVFGSTATASVLLELNQQETCHALGIAASSSSGIRVNFGTMTKPLHAGFAAQHGVTAAQLAKLGYLSSPDALDGPWGFFQVAGGGYDQNRIRGRLGTPYTIEWPGISVKPYPCGSLLHPAMDALSDIVLEEDIRPDQVKEVRIGTQSNVLAALRYDSPKDELEAKFSIPFCLSVLLIDRKAGIHQFSPETIRRPDVLAMMPLVKSYLHEELEAQGFDRIRSQIEIVLEDGRHFSRYAETNRGTPENPMSDKMLEEKFTDCARESLSQEKIDQALTEIWRLDKLTDLSQLIALLE